MTRYIRIPIILLLFAACEQKNIAEKQAEVVYVNPDVLSQPLDTDYDHKNIEGVINQTRIFFPEMLDYHINVEYHYMNLDKDHFIGIQKITFYVPSKIVHAYLDETEIKNRAIKLMAAFGRDEECLNAELSEFDSNFAEKAEASRTILIEYAC